MVKVGIFWVVPDGVGGQTVLHVLRQCNLSEAEALGFINYPYSHFEIWDCLHGKRNDDCCYYPRGRVLYDVNRGIHRIFADRCIDENCIREIVNLFEADQFEVLHDGHYVNAFIKNRGQKNRPKLKYNILRGKDRIGEIKVTPFLCDHSAYDSYMLLFEAYGQSVLYTGDFRFHGRKESLSLLSALPKNIDRLVSFYRASKLSGRIFYEDNYTAMIAGAAGGKIPRPDVFPDVYSFTPVPQRGRRKDIFL
ncbi:MAG: hypothetical protein ACI4QI_07475, partial [Candidatus Coproplasma sp.]